MFEMEEFSFEMQLEIQFSPAATFLVHLQGPLPKHIRSKKREQVICMIILYINE